MALADPTEDLATPTLPQVLQLAIENRLEDLHTHSWGTVLAYNRTAQTCSVQIIPRRHYVDEDGAAQTEQPAPLVNVPVVFPGCGAFSITWPINPGDVVLLLFMETALDAYMVTGRNDVDSGDNRKHHITDAVAIPGLRPSTAPVPPTSTDGSAMVIDGGGATASEIATKASLAEFKTVLATVADSAGACASLKSALDIANWPNNYVSAVKVK